MDLVNMPHASPPGTSLETERACFAHDITCAFETSRKKIFEIDRLLIEAKAALPHGEFLAMTESDLPFTARYAQMFEDRK